MKAPKLTFRKNNYTHVGGNIKVFIGNIARAWTQKISQTIYSLLTIKCIACSRPLELILAVDCLEGFDQAILDDWLKSWKKYYVILSLSDHLIFIGLLPRQQWKPWQHSRPSYLPVHYFFCKKNAVISFWILKQRKEPNIQINEVRCTFCTHIWRILRSPVFSDQKSGTIFGWSLHFFGP